MKNFEYAVPESIEKAIEYINSPKSALKGAGIDLLDLMKEQLVEPSRIVTIRDLEELRFLKEDTNGNLLIGPSQTLTEISDNSIVNNSYKALAQAVAGVASVQIRNSATLGGKFMSTTPMLVFS